MAIRTAEEYRQSIQKMKRKAYLGGKKLDNLMQDPTIKTIVEANVKVYELAELPQYRDVMTATSHLTGERISRALHINQNTDDLLKRAEMALLTSQKLGTCNYRCPGCDALNALASVTWEIDKKKGTEYYHRLCNYIKFVQANDLAVSGAMTDTKGDRSKRPLEQDPDAYVHIVEKTPEGIIVNGAKEHQSGSIIADETVVLPGIACRKGEEDYALAFAFTGGAEGVSYISQYTPFTAEREAEENVWYLGNPIYGQRETCLIIFDKVFIPWDRVFMCGEIEYTQRCIARFAKMHRMNCGGACKVGFADLIIGATQLLAEYTGLHRVPHVVAEITNMVKVRETSHACALASAYKGREDPLGSGVWLPDDVYGNVAKLNTCHGFWDIMAWAGDIAGGIAVTMPHEKDLENPETRGYIEKYLKGAAPANKRLRITKFLQHWVAGLHGVATWQGAGAAQAQMLTLYRLTDFEEKKKLAKELAGIKD